MITAFFVESHVFCISKVFSRVKFSLQHRVCLRSFRFTFVLVLTCLQMRRVSVSILFQLVIAPRVYLTFWRLFGSSFFWYYTITLKTWARFAGNLLRFCEFLFNCFFGTFAVIYNMAGSIILAYFNVWNLFLFFLFVEYLSSIGVCQKISLFHMRRISDFLLFQKLLSFNGFNTFLRPRDGWPSLWLNTFMNSILLDSIRLRNLRDSLLIVLQSVSSKFGGVLHSLGKIVIFR